MSETVEKQADNLKDRLSAYKTKLSNILGKSVSYFVLVFCLFLFPGYFLYSSLTMYFRNDADNLRQAKLIEMNNALEYMEKYSNNKKYFHFLLSRISEFAQTSENPLEYVKKSIANLKEKYPNKFEFVVWNEKGKVIKELNDKNSYGYVLGKLYEILKEVKSEIKEDASVRIANLELIKKNTKLVRNFLGKVFVPENLKIPMLDNQNAGPIMTEIGNGFTNCWYYIGEKISIFCFIAKPVIDDFSGLSKIIKSINSHKSDVYAGYSITPDYIRPVSDFPIEYESDIALALSTFENAGDSVFENDKILMKMTMPQPNVRTFAFIPKSDLVWDYKYKTNLWSGILYACLLLIYCCWGFWFLYKQNFFYIRWKLTALFLFANLVPITIVGFIAKGYVDNRRLSLKNEIIGELERKLREFDARYTSQMDDFTIRINDAIEPIASKIGKNFIKSSEIQEFRNLYDKFNCSEFYLVASDSTILDSARDVSVSKKNTGLMSAMATTVIKYANKQLYNKKNEIDFFTNVINFEDSDLVRQSVKNNKKVTVLSLGEYTKIYYMQLLGNTVNYENNYIVVLCWNNRPFQELFIKNTLKYLNSDSLESIFIVTAKDAVNERDSKNINDELLSIFEKNSGMAEKNTGSYIFNKNKYLYICLNANNMQGQIMLGLYPEKKVDMEINIIIIQIVIGALLSLLLTIIIGHILSMQFLNPIKNLGEAALAIGNRDFQYRLPVGDKDEFGHLNQVLNHAIEGLEDFEVAKIVQESLFPGNNFDVGDCKIFGKSVVMTTLGGDYYDCFKINDEYTGIIIGDVAGHGIPAGLMMAMAKSGVLSAPEEVKLDAAVLTARLHKILHAIKNEKLKRMMTFMYFVLRVSDGHFMYTNAGHCLPFVIDGSKKTAEYLDYIAVPLGIGARCRCKNQEFVLEKGQSLVLYTDGIVEACNSEGEQYGYDRFKESLIKFYDPDPEVFYYNLYNKVYKAWSEKPDDDLTFIIVNRN